MGRSEAGMWAIWKKTEKHIDTMQWVKEKEKEKKKRRAGEVRHQSLDGDYWENTLSWFFVY